MNRTVIAAIGVIIALVLGTLVFWLVSTSTQPAQQEQDDSLQPPASEEEAVELPESQSPPNGQVVESASVAIENQSFVNSAITVKKGTTVTWTNKDDIGHNVVSDSNAPAGGPPATNSLLGKDETFSYTYDIVGVFPYHCESHPFMQGTVTVTE